MESYYDTKKIYDIDELEIPKYAFILLWSKRRSGKSVLSKAIIKNIVDKYEIDFVVLFWKTAKFNNDYDFIDKQFIFDYEEAETKIEKIMDYQKKYKLSKKQCPNGIIVFDDIILYRKWYKIIDLSSMGRHFNLFTIMSVQYPKMVCDTSIRNNIDMVFFNDLNYQGEEAILKSIHIPYKYNDFHDFIDKFNDNYTFILYDNCEKDKKKRIKLVRAKMMDLKFI